MRKIELLAPARTAEIGIEAVRHGADAVYIGAQAFGARAAAGNRVEDIERLVDFAHQYLARVYVTVNTVVFDTELPEVERLCWQLWEIGVDGLIIQDLRLLSLNLPPIPLHASTQMDNRTAEQVQQLAELGFPQVVLARELTLKEIHNIHETCPGVRLEVFVHGALCVSLSGRCNVSEALFGRSANRGACAQVCRMEMELIAQNVPQTGPGYWLSLKDNCQIENLERLLLAGASSLKIEGRLKDMAYVKNVTAAYSEALDAVIARHPGELCRQSAGHVRLKFQPNVWKSFNRGFVADVSKPDANIYTPKSMGEPLVGKMGGRKNGKMEDSIATKPVIHNGDGLCYMDGNQLIGFRVNNAETFKERPGVQYFRNFDIEWERMLAKPSAERRVWVDIDVWDDRVEMRDENGIIVGIGIDLSNFEHALTPQEENVRRQLGRLGDTLYEARNVQTHWSKPWFVPSSQLAAWRRQLVEQLNKARRAAYPRAEQPHKPVVVETGQPYELTHDKDVPLMLTKYCLRRQLGCCLKEGGRPDNWALRLKNGRMLRLAFDCGTCMMKVLGMVCAMFFLLCSCVGAGTSREGETACVADTIVNIVDTATVETDSALIGFSSQQVDSLVFRLTHHYSENFNFIVKTDSLMLVPREGDLAQDTCWVYDEELVVVAAVSNQGDTVWVKVAHDQQTMGWIAESQLLRGVSPDDPISEWLYWLSSWRGIWMSVLAVIGVIAILLRRGRQQQLQLLKFEEMDSPYPVVFVALVAIMASVYASVQNFVPEYWQEYYFHPSLNPLMLPPVMAVLVTLVWLLIITFIAVADEVYHHFDILHAAAYLFELVGIGMIVYLLISWTTIYYIGYLLLPAFLYACFIFKVKMKVE